MIETVVDFITGKTVPAVGAEANRQTVEKFLVNQKGFSKEEIEVDVDLDLVVAGEPYRSQVDLVVTLKGRRVSSASPDPLDPGSGKSYRCRGFWKPTRSRMR